MKWQDLSSAHRNSVLHSCNNEEAGLTMETSSVNILGSRLNVYIYAPDRPHLQFPGTYTSASSQMTQLFKTADLKRKMVEICIFSLPYFPLFRGGSLLCPWLALPGVIIYQIDPSRIM